MLADRYDLPLSTASGAARDAYVQGCDLQLALYPGAIEAFDRAIAADPAFALAHATKAQVLLQHGRVDAARTSLAAAQAAAAGASAREASHIAFLDALVAGRSDAALAALYPHIRAWPRDALVLAMAATPNGLIGASGHLGQKRTIMALIDSVATEYGDDWWFGAHHAMALSEVGQFDAAEARLARSMAQNPDNAWAAHARAHISYETGDPDTARAFLGSWLSTYPRDGNLHGHLSWHLALGELEAGHAEAALRRFQDYAALDTHCGTPRQKLQDAASFLWRWELAGHPRNAEAWQAMHDFTRQAFPRAGSAFIDMHVALTHAAAGDGEDLEAWVRQMEELDRQGRYAAGPVVPALARAFAAFQRQDFAAAIAALEPFAGDIERLGGSRAQLDLLEFTLLRACLAAGRPDDVRRLLGQRRPGATGLPVAGIDARH